MGGGVCRDPQKWLRNIWMTPNAMDVLQMQMQHCNKCQNNQDRYIAEILILPINLRYIQKKEFHHYF